MGLEFKTDNNGNNIPVVPEGSDDTKGLLHNSKNEIEVSSDGGGGGSANTGTLAENLSVTTAYAFDWSKDTFLLNMVADTTFTESNLPEAGKTKTISIYMSGDFIPTFPGDWSTNVTGVYDGTVTNLIVVEYIKANTYWVIITQAD